LIIIKFTEFLYFYTSLWQMGTASGMAFGFYKVVSKVESKTTKNECKQVSK